MGVQSQVLCYCTVLIWLLGTQGITFYHMLLELWPVNSAMLIVRGFLRVMSSHFTDKTG